MKKAEKENAEIAEKIENAEEIAEEEKTENAGENAEEEEKTEEEKAEELRALIAQAENAIKEDRENAGKCKITYIISAKSKAIRLNKNSMDRLNEEFKEYKLENNWISYSARPMLYNAIDALVKAYSDIFYIENK